MKERVYVILIVTFFGFMWWYGQTIGFAKITGPLDGFYIQSEPIQGNRQAWIINELEIQVISSDGNTKKYSCKQYSDRIVIEGFKDYEKEYPMNIDGSFTLFTKEEHIGLSYEVGIFMIREDTSVNYTVADVIKRLQSLKQ